MISILGINHEIQHNRNLSSKYLFGEFLENFCIQKNIQLIAEEFSSEALEKSNVKSTIPKDIADKLELQHIYCDPTTKQRDEYGIKKGDYNLREYYWLEQIADFTSLDILFICGTSHLSTFAEKLKNEGLNHQKISKEFNYSSF